MRSRMLHLSMTEKVKKTCCPLFDRFRRMTFPRRISIRLDVPPCSAGSSRHGLRRMRTAQYAQWVVRMNHARVLDSASRRTGSMAAKGRGLGLEGERGSDPMGTSDVTIPAAHPGGSDHRTGIWVNDSILQLLLRLLALHLPEPSPGSEGKDSRTIRDQCFWHPEFPSRAASRMIWKPLRRPRQVFPSPARP